MKCSYCNKDAKYIGSIFSKNKKSEELKACDKHIGIVIAHQNLELNMIKLRESFAKIND